MLPVAAFAVDANYLVQNYESTSCSAPVRSLAGLINLVLCTLQSLMPIFFVVALLFFLYSAIQFIRAEDKTRDEARNKLLYGLVGLFAMTAVWGLVGVLSGTFNLTNTMPNLPSYPRL